MSSVQDDYLHDAMRDLALDDEEGSRRGHHAQHRRRSPLPRRRRRRFRTPPLSEATGLPRWRPSDDQYARYASRHASDHLSGFRPYVRVAEPSGHSSRAQPFPPYLNVRKVRVARPGGSSNIGSPPKPPVYVVSVPPRGYNGRRYDSREHGDPPRIDHRQSCPR